MYTQAGTSKGSNNTGYRETLLLQPVCPIGLENDF